MRCVIVETPYKGDVTKNTTYARACLNDCLVRGEAPFASHLLYTQPGVLDDTLEFERRRGILAGLAIGARLDATVVYTDLGISDGMRWGITEAQRVGRSVEYRTLGNPE